jgi:thioredoxin reductase
VVIVGAGPAGFSASLSAKQHGLRSVTLEQDSLGGTVFNFPRGKVVMTAPVNLPIVGKIKIRETTKEALLKMWLAIEKKTQVKINYKEKMDDIKATDTGFEVTTNKATYQTRAVLLTIGRRGTPRKLGVKGEEQAKVVYNLIDPAQYKNQHILIVGGGDSALEAALSIADEEGTHVTISYRSESFSRAKQKNQDKISEAVKVGKIKLLLPSTVDLIEKDSVTLNVGENKETIKNNGVIVCAGGILPTPFLKQIGINVETKHGQI